MAAKRPARAGKTSATPEPLVLYIHGIGEQPAPADLKAEWDIALFGQEMGARTSMAYWADILHPKGGKQPPQTKQAASTTPTVDPTTLLQEAGVSTTDANAMRLVQGLLRAMGVTSPDAGTKALALPPALRRPLAKAFLEATIKDTAAYFFRPGMRAKIQARLRQALPKDGRLLTLVAHSQGSVIALEVLTALPASDPPRVYQFVTIGSPLGIQEVQEFLDCPRPLAVPGSIRLWNNFSDPLDLAALDKGLAHDFSSSDRVVDEVIRNTRTRVHAEFNPHSAAGYLAHPKVRAVVCGAARVDPQARFLVARDVAETLAVEERQSVLIEILEPGYRAIDESQADMEGREEKETDGGKHTLTLAARIDRAAQGIEKIVERSNPGKLNDAAIDKLRRFVAARLTAEEVQQIAHDHQNLRVYAIWKSNVKRRLLHRSHRVVQADAARSSYGASGEGVRWAILDTGLRFDHPHFEPYKNIEQIWDCTRQGPPVRAAGDLDLDGHGTHVAGIVAGTSRDKVVQGIAPQAKLVVYKVLKEDGSGEDAWIIKALDHIAEQNENNSEIFIHGVNLSLGGSYDASVYGCGFTPICAELRRAWRSGVLVVVACGNEGQVEVKTPDGDAELNSPMSIGDPANLEECVAVGSVNADRPHLYGISAFSSRGPTSDGRAKPDVVAPGERILSCNSSLGKNPKRASPKQLYRVDSGTSMAAPHVSGVLAAFLSVRKEFKGRPDEVKELLLKTCTDIGRDRYHQGRGIPNLMRMLLEA
jgi:subtilisin family serine protease